jgi:hypothetical protein
MGTAAAALAASVVGTTLVGGTVVATTPLDLVGGGEALGSWAALQAGNNKPADAATARDAPASRP